ncbi:class I SAM-dependent methyltransferase [Clostridium sp. C2-6-12]|uniref:class I SAM-dependent methyltransferase n=1 Tax=Clostridium sp. C2-6-12 TaxID=2698832 RepID=UPI00325FBB93
MYNKNGEYEEVFKNYTEILDETVMHISKSKDAKILDIGAGTGNLTLAVSKAGYNVIGIEPNAKMRNIALKKAPLIPFLPGTFLSLPIDDNSIDAIISSYAFHHLTDSEKEESIKLLKSKLKKNGTIIITDTMYDSIESRESIIKDSYSKNFLALAHDLETEFYSTCKFLKKLFEAEGFIVTFQQMNKFVWILTAKLI